MDIGDIFFCRQPSAIGTVPPGSPVNFYGVIEDLPRPFRIGQDIVRTTVFYYLDGQFTRYRRWNLIVEDLEILDL